MENGQKAEEGSIAAFHLAGALIYLGFPESRIPDIGSDFAAQMEAESPDDEAFRTGFLEYFNELRSLKEWRPGMELPSPGALGISEFLVIDGLVKRVADALGEGLPHSAPALRSILDRYDAYLAESGAAAVLLERARRIRHAVEELEDLASGRG